MNLQAPRDWQAERAAVNAAEWEAFQVYAKAERTLKPYVASGRRPPLKLAQKVAEALSAWDLTTAERQKFLAEWARHSLEDES